MVVAREVNNKLISNILMGSLNEYNNQIRN